MTSWLKQHPLVAFFILANAISWAVAVPLIASAQGWLKTPVPFALHYLTAYGPMLAAILVTWLTESDKGLRDLFGRMTKWRVGPGWAIVAVLSPFALFAVSAVIAWIMGVAWPDLRLLGKVNYLPYLGPGVVWLLWFFTSGVGEETGWRGYALPKLQQNRSALSATLILGVLWALWHLPFFFYLDDYVKLGLVGYPAFAMSVIAGAIVFTWLYNSTGGSILMAILFHASLNTVTASSAGEGTIALISSVLVIVWAVVVVVLYGPARLARPSGAPLHPVSRPTAPSAR
jgi:membrane protease YdiL (CAAX protease family)